MKINNILTEKNKDMNKNPDFEQNHYSRTSVGIYKIGYESLRLVKWLIYFDRCFYENINYFDLTGSRVKSVKESIRTYIRVFIFYFK